jgi:hypothetical protein
MAPRPALPRLLIAMLSMVATMLGALEHESLLFQGSACMAADLSPVIGGVSVAIPDSGEAFSRDGAETGTEGTYRSETQILWTAPADGCGTSWRVPAYDPFGTRVEIPPHLDSQARFRVTGVLALRI